MTILSYIGELLIIKTYNLLIVIIIVTIVMHQ
jgi:hypothetical protein